LIVPTVLKRDIRYRWTVCCTFRRCF